MRNIWSKWLTFSVLNLIVLIEVLIALKLRDNFRNVANGQTIIPFHMIFLLLLFGIIFFAIALLIFWKVTRKKGFLNQVILQLVLASTFLGAGMAFLFIGVDELLRMYRL